MATSTGFQELDIRIGTITDAVVHPHARKPSYQLTLDFGAAGIRRSSAQLTARYAPKDLIGRQVTAVVNLPPRRIAGFTSDVLVLGAMVSGTDVVLLTPDQPVENGTAVG